MARKHNSAEDRPINAGFYTTEGGSGVSARPENDASDNGKGGASRPSSDSVRRAGPAEDWAQLMVVLREAFAGMAGRIDPPSSLDNMATEDLARIAAQHEVWVIGDPAFATVTLRLRADCLYVGKLAVRPDHRGRGYGRHLIGLAENRARALGRDALMLETRVELIENQTLFRHLGFAEAARRAHPGFDRATTVEFRKSVTPV
jgi:GNAT superfamily N-acetyltransferase